jgi:hypothetical protein
LKAAIQNVLDRVQLFHKRHAAQFALISNQILDSLKAASAIESTTSLYSFKLNPDFDAEDETYTVGTADSTEPVADESKAAKPSQQLPVSSATASPGERKVESSESTDGDINYRIRNRLSQPSRFARRAQFIDLAAYGFNVTGIAISSCIMFCRAMKNQNRCRSDEGVGEPSMTSRGTLSTRAITFDAESESTAYLATKAEKTSDIYTSQDGGRRLCILTESYNGDGKIYAYDARSSFGSSVSLSTEQVMPCVINLNQIVEVIKSNT